MEERGEGCVAGLLVGFWLRRGMPELLGITSSLLFLWVKLSFSVSLRVKVQGHFSMLRLADYTLEIDSIILLFSSFVSFLWDKYLMFYCCFFLAFFV